MKLREGQIVRINARSNPYRKIVGFVVENGKTRLQTKKMIISGASANWLPKDDVNPRVLLEEDTIYIIDEKNVTAMFGRTKWTYVKREI